MNKEKKTKLSCRRNKITRTRMLTLTTNVRYGNRNYASKTV